MSIAFLERMKADFKKRYGGGKADTATAKSLNKDFGYVKLRNTLKDDTLISFMYANEDLLKEVTNGNATTFNDTDQL